MKYVTSLCSNYSLRPDMGIGVEDGGWDMQDEELGGADHSPKIVHIEAQMRLAEFSITGETIEDIAAALVSDSIVGTEAAAAAQVRTRLLHCCTSIETYSAASAPAHV
jgi:hypothetical protein